MGEEGSEILNLINTGGSLPVPNVQAISDASKNCTEIPEKYVRPEMNESLAQNGAAGPGDFPIIDLSRLCQDSEEEIAKLGAACEDWGFFMLINHGVPDEVIEKMRGVITKFFSLPLEEKKEYAQRPGTIEGYGQTFVISEEQKLDWGDMYFLSTRPVAGRNLKLWPTSPPNFRDALHEYCEELQKVGTTLLESVEKSLKINTLMDNHKDGLQAIRINYYPPCPQASKVLGISPHSDAVSLTVLLQVNDVQGLQIRKDGAWYPIKPIPGAFIVNVGDIIEIMSNGKYKSIEHRAVVDTDRERLSLATFFSPGVKGRVEPLPEILEKSEARYKSASMEEYIKMLFSFKLEGKNILDHMKLPA